MSQFEIRQTVNLRAENSVKVYEKTLAYGNKRAHRWDVHVLSGREVEDLTGYTGTLYIVRADGKTVCDQDAVTIMGNVASAVFPAEAYAQEGWTGFLLELAREGEVITCAEMSAMVKKGKTETIVLPGQGEIVDLEALLKRMAEMKAATSAANTAAGSATAAASAANTAAGSANAAAGAANTAAGKANTAADTANAAAERLDGLTATATGLATGSKPTVAVTTGADGAKVLAFGIPKGDKGNTGLTPQLTIKVLTGAPGTQASVVQSGTADNPVITLTIPRGDTGDIGKLTVCGVSPDASGAVALGITLAVDENGAGTLAIGGGSA